MGGDEFGGGKERAVVKDGEADGEADGEVKEREEEEREEREWEKEVVGALESLKTVSVTDGPPSRPRVPFFAAAYHFGSYRDVVGGICEWARRWVIFEDLVRVCPAVPFLCPSVPLLADD